MADQRTLLADYVTHASERAFSDIVHGYIGLVYSTALRLVNGDTHRAEDVVQTVFADLARLAKTLPKDVMLGGWLHRRTFHVATTLIRTERRRTDRERQACEMNALHDDSDGGLEQIFPHLDEAIDELNERDRTAILLRFFERRDLRAIGAALGSNEDAAQKSVSRAVEKLRAHFIRRGITVGSAAIISALAANAVHAAPAGLASSVTAAALAGTAGAGTLGSVSFLTKCLIMKKTITTTTLLVLAVFLTSVTAAKYSRYRAAHAPVTEKKLLQGLALHLTFDHDQEGGSVTDSSGQRNHGNATGARWIPDGKKGGAYEFTKDGDQILVPNQPSLNSGQFTLSAWIKTTTGDYYWRRIFDKSYTQGFAMSVAGDWQKNDWRGRVSMEIGPGTHFIITTNKINDGLWHHVASTFDGTNEIIYIDGKINVQGHYKKPSPAGNSGFDLVIGCNRSNLDKKEDDLGVSFRGCIDEPMVWNRALSEKEITYLYQSQNGSPATETARN